MNPAIARRKGSAVAEMIQISASIVMAAHSRPKDGVATARLRPAIHVPDVIKNGHDESGFVACAPRNGG
jgi:hypothetical protein